MNRPHIVPGFADLRGVGKTAPGARAFRFAPGGRDGYPPGMLVAAASIAVLVADKVLLVKRRRGPFAGRWSLPGGKIEPGESAAEAAVRELAEETGLTVAAPRLVITMGPEEVGADFAIAVHMVAYQGGTPRPSAEVAGFGWFGASDLARLETTPGLAAVVAACLERCTDR